MDKTLLRYYLFTIPHVTLFSGAIFGILILMGIDVKLATGIFAFLYGTLLMIISLIVREHFRESRLYKLSLLAFLTLLLAGAFIIILSI
ncbi:hypothetical protein [Pyrococcus horikoshii]|nr:hypothetical protein [Pyrococcus horikoshii]